MLVEEFIISITDLFSDSMAEEYLFIIENSYTGGIRAQKIQFLISSDF